MVMDVVRRRLVVRASGHRKRGEQVLIGEGEALIPTAVLPTRRLNVLTRHEVIVGKNAIVGGSGEEIRSIFNVKNAVAEKMATKYDDASTVKRL